MELCLDVILMDLVMEEMDGIDLIKVILKDWLEVKIIIVMSFIDDEKVYLVIEVGVVGYLLKILIVYEIVDVIWVIYCGECVLEFEVMYKMMEWLIKK